MNPAKRTALWLIRRVMLKRLWLRLFNLSLVAMNYHSSSEHETGEIKALKFIDEHLTHQIDNKIVFDVGANQGQYAKICAKILRPLKIYSFEPSSESHTNLLNTIANDPLLENLIPVNMGLSDKEEIVNLYTSYPGSTTASLYNLKHPLTKFQPEHTELISTTTLDIYCEQKKIRTISLLKIDAEGSELRVLKGANRLLKEKAIECIQFEFGPANIDSRTYLRDFFELLESSYDIYRILPNGLFKVAKYDPSLEIFATMNYLAIRK